MRPMKFSLAVRRINCEKNPFALINMNGKFGDDLLAWDISEKFAPLLARVTGAVFQG